MPSEVGMKSLLLGACLMLRWIRDAALLVAFCYVSALFTAAIASAPSDFRSTLELTAAYTAVLVPWAVVAEWWRERKKRKVPRSPEQRTFDTYEWAWKASEMTTRTSDDLLRSALKAHSVPGASSNLDSEVFQPWLTAWGQGLPPRKARRFVKATSSP